MTFDDRPDPAKRLQRARESRGFKTPKDASRFFGWSYETYIQHEHGTRGIPRAASRYANAFRVSEGWLLTGEGTGPKEEADVPSATLTELPNAFVGDKLPVRVNTIPLYGHAVGGQDGEFVLDGNKLDDISAPPSISGAKDAYAVTVAGDSMEPRYEDGETVFVDPNRRVHRGDYVVAQIQYEEEGPRLAYIKRFIKHTADELVLEQFNPPKQLTFPHANVHSVHYIVMGGRVV